MGLVELRQTFEVYLDDQIRSSRLPMAMLEPISYSLQGGGKRLRPLITLAILEAQEGEVLDHGLATALALEAVHTYSLIHDDLPAMDDDDFRRGQPTNHKQFNEATAILAGDALVTDAFGLIAQDPSLNDKQKVDLLGQLSLASGSKGMVLGQLGDLLAEGQEVSLETLQAIHEKKTGCLFSFAVEAGIVIGEVLGAEAKLLREWGQTFGLAYQIHNDLKAVTEDDQVTGKSGNSDQIQNKSTYPKLLGLGSAQELLAEKNDQAYGLVQEASQLSGKDYCLLAEITGYIDLRRVGEA